MNDEWYFVLKLMEITKEDLLAMNRMASDHSFIGKSL